MIAFWNDTVTFGDVISLAVGYGIGKAIAYYVVWKRLTND